MIVTFAVPVVRVEVIAVSLAQPLLLTVTFKLTHSLALMMPLLLPVVESSIATALNWRLELPVMQKFCVAVPPLPTVTEGDAGVEEVQLRLESVAVAV